MNKCLLLGNGGREAVLAEYIIEKYSLYSIMPYENPSIVDYVEKSNGKYIVADPFDKECVKNFILENDIDTCVISSDNLLRDGLIDLAKSLGLKTFGPTSKGSKIEWSKSYALDIVKKLAPEMVIRNEIVTDEESLRKIVDSYDEDNFVVKPDGLTGGKGVKVGGIHFHGKEEGFIYAKECLDAAGRVIIQDKIEGREFTVMCLTDGKGIVVTPTTFDYPYRFDEDKGPGTGGMGCLSFKDGLLPFLDKEDIEKCADLIKKTINYINKDSFEFNGVLYGGFFKCKSGIKFIEFNSRFGDPEALNVLNSLKTPFVDVLEHIFNKTLTNEVCKFKDKYTCCVYIVSPNYAIKSSKDPLIFSLNTDEILKKDAKIYFASTKKIDKNKYSSVGTSRLFAIVSQADTLDEAVEKVYTAIDGNLDESLDFRKDIGKIYEH